MAITKHLKKGTYDVTLSGNFTFDDHTDFRDVLQQMSEADVRHVVFHMNKLEFIDSAALGMLLLARDEAQKHQKNLAISGATGQVKKMFDMARFDTLFAMN